MADASLATLQRSLGNPDVTYPLWPPLTSGCPTTSTEDVAYPLEVDYAYDQVPRDLFAARPARGVGLDRWAPLLPPLAAPGLGEGCTPLVELEPGVYVKDESRNPTWSHKDRLNRCTTSAAVGVCAPGIVVASSGNHGASAAAFAARAGLRCVVFASLEMPPAVDAFLHAYDAIVLPVPWKARWPLMRLVVERMGLHPVSNLTTTHTGHPFGPEGYKSVAYEIFTEIGVPEAVFCRPGTASSSSASGRASPNSAGSGTATACPGSSPANRPRQHPLPRPCVRAYRPRTSRWASPTRTRSSPPSADTAVSSSYGRAAAARSS
ncbi:hypothetical protein HEB94_007182 [Actinopolymorpha pittospori]|uniref:Tryptophan synthase beta chain-like PALP domain-containing protein n=1 Tax=Actinopolymorpha pittospori TaxID=648752 RepID=A0A927N1J1_9ACTN|nr:hypothetical protein [Actinopolymorpha pittospori]